ncbi:MAG: efflux RND transporter periplasmic adaptor subunit [Gemmataceae bacterium]
MFLRTLLLAASLSSLALLPGCAKKTEKQKPPPPEVVYTTPQSRDVTEIEEFTGYTRAVKTVEVRARVTGYLDKVNFKDGADIKEGDLLFLIDPRTYQAEADKAEAMLKSSEATLERLTSDVRRGRTLASGRAISSEELERLTSTRNEADAAVRAAKASLESTKLSVGFTRVTAPITGRLSRRMVDPGNLVKADDTMLTTVVSLDPIQAYFDVDERTVLKLRRMIQEKKIESGRTSRIDVKVGLADEEGFSRTGTIDFVDNQLDAGTGTLRVRAEVPNAAINGTSTLSPGMFVRVQLPVGKPQPSLLVPETALGSDQGNKFVYVLDDKNKVVYRRIVPGQQEGALRVIRPVVRGDKGEVVSGLGPDERVIVTGQQRVRPGVEANPMTQSEMTALVEKRATARNGNGNGAH